ncbi:6-phosphofructo-2-kinase [Exophiala dermatitidis]|uniref:6-phosphofructo-2-kinase n=2 Tax=Exophiala dermatitidis TaxID=5970 RepID=H6CC08_EXODN|nr:6-phosphofructo-2-kinase [Exophiala dermatitidis NIH/UT8656]KAJ4502619.1 6-phosphofructo-2-kinase [Exophiala dermatitidis]EHY61305.1 6-phosphofructo-2-kinase [Exophiala dermatitidis NIH/UT8656]KAJ4503461.1 6-phosphofructo-2-kinase [Exophiala dermatitidis]KAJ4504063.1 6-phosphofructo-2-kinase [Exophiala dermatitidis]KAJ4528948.1 6-phosphofructo-2-kinase [Exophiala dermatitidis]
MPQLEGSRQPSPSENPGPALNAALFSRRVSEQYSDLARTAIMTNASSSPNPEAQQSMNNVATSNQPGLMPPPKTPFGRASSNLGPSKAQPQPQPQPANNTAMGIALTDTPAPSAPGSPQIHARGSANASGTATPKIRATTLDIPGLTRSKVSPDGRISERDVGAKLIIIMVGLPARGKSYITKKVARYLNWLQHPTRIFNVGDRRRVAAGVGPNLPDRTDAALRESIRRMSSNTTTEHSHVADQGDFLPPPAIKTEIRVNGEVTSPTPLSPPPTNASTESGKNGDPILLPAPEPIDQSARFFDPENTRAKQLREQVAHQALDELLKYVLEDGGSVGILDATNHTQERRMSLIQHIRQRDENINVLFLESRCQDQNLLEANMRLKLSGPDYRGKDPVVALQDFQERVRQYEKSYQKLDEFEEEHDMPYCSMVDVGRKMVSFQVKGFLSIQTVTYLMNFNLAPRQIWITRHGESMDNVNGKIGGDSSLSPNGVRYARALSKFMEEQWKAWEANHAEKKANTHFPPRPGDTTPPNPAYTAQTLHERNFCVWTSMLKRSIETSQFFDEDEFDIKQMRMLDELNAGVMEGMTYKEIREKFHHEYELRKRDKLHYRYPGPGGEGYLDIINRLGKVILEIERMTDHVLIIGHRSICRVLLAYFMGLAQEDISDLDVPLGVVYSLEPRPYGVDFKAYRWDPVKDEFRYEPDYQMRRATDPQAA